MKIKRGDLKFRKSFPFCLAGHLELSYYDTWFMSSHPFPLLTREKKIRCNQLSVLSSKIVQFLVAKLALLVLTNDVEILFYLSGFSKIDKALSNFVYKTFFAGLLLVIE